MIGSERVKVLQNARECRSYTSNLSLKAFPISKFLKTCAKTNARNRLFKQYEFALHDTVDISTLLVVINILNCLGLHCLILVSYTLINL